MVSIIAKKLDELMGKNRNVPLKEHLELENYFDPEVCKKSLVAICPQNLFPNSKYDFGACDKRHDDFFKLQFEKERDLKRLIHEKNYLEATYKLFADKVAIVDDKIKKSQSKQDVALYRGEIPLEYQEK